MDWGSRRRVKRIVWSMVASFCTSCWNRFNVCWCLRPHWSALIPWRVYVVSVLVCVCMFVCVSQILLQKMWCCQSAGGCARNTRTDVHKAHTRERDPSAAAAAVRWWWWYAISRGGRVGGSWNATGSRQSNGVFLHTHTHTNTWNTRRGRAPIHIAPKVFVVSCTRRHVAFYCIKILVYACASVCVCVCVKSRYSSLPRGIWCVFDVAHGSRSRHSL